MFFFSPPGEKKQPKRELVARFESEQITILKNCAAGLASLKQVLALPSSPFFNHRICVPDSLAIATIINYQLSISHWHGVGCSVRIATAFLAITTNIE